MQRSPEEAGEAATRGLFGRAEGHGCVPARRSGAVVHGSPSLSEMGGEAGSSGVGGLRGSGKLEEATSEESRAGRGSTERRLGKDSGPQRVRDERTKCLGSPQLGLAKQSFGKEEGARELKSAG